MLNSFLGIGRLGKDAEVLTTQNGNAMAKFNIAIERNHKPDQASEPDWIPCKLFGDRARALAPHLTKGLLVGVRGRLESFRIPGEQSFWILYVYVWELEFLYRPSPKTAGAPQPAA